MISCSHWGMFEEPRRAMKDTAELMWKQIADNMLADPQLSYDSKYLHG